jgi:biotin operon repressor
MTEPLPDVWTSRDYPVLREIARRIDGGARTVSHHELTEALNMTEPAVNEACQALRRRGLIQLMAIDQWFDVVEISSQAYLLTGLHPNGDDAVSRLIDALEQAAEQATDPVQKGKLKRMAELVGSLPRDVAAGVLTAVLTGGMG